jgi:hypothetical protein
MAMIEYKTAGAANDRSSRNPPSAKFSRADRPFTRPIWNGSKGSEGGRTLS